jgi:hypothetical protein
MKKNKYVLLGVLIASFVASWALIVHQKPQSFQIDTRDEGIYFDQDLGDVIHPVAKVVDDAGYPTKELLAVLKALNIEHSGTLQDIVHVTQKRWLRPRDKERWQIEDACAEKEVQLLPLLAALGMTQDVHASKMHYDYAFLLGSRLGSVKKRLQFLIDEWNRGVRFNTVVLMSGYRELTEDEKQELRGSLPRGADFPQTEPAMMRLVYAMSALPQDMANLPVQLVSAQAQPQQQRATTEDTIKTWLNSSPLPGTVLSISSQPFIGYQHAVTDTYLPQVFLLETIGPVEPERSSVAVMLDNLARWLYQELMMRSNSE